MLIHEVGSSNWFNSEVGELIIKMISGGEVLHFLYNFLDFMLF